MVYVVYVFDVKLKSWTIDCTFDNKNDAKGYIGKMAKKNSKMYYIEPKVLKGGSVAGIL